ncbi:DUF323 domain-containing protein [Colletotrichum higginsianum]|nr:DUF323 domain-containing protein [Colletotrichum higginsianum]
MAARSNMVVPEHGGVLDIGGGQMSSNILENLRRVFVVAKNPVVGGELPTMPDELLYDDKGLAIWADIIFTPQFYQTRDEIALFERNSGEMAEHYIPDNATLIDLGAGTLPRPRRRQRPHGGPLGRLPGRPRLCRDHHGRPRVFLSLGSVLFNDPWKKAVASLRDWAALMRPGDLILAGMDGHDVTSDKVWDAYHSHPALFESFFYNGFAHANALLGEPIFRPRDWDICAEIEEDEKRHRFFVKAKRDVVSETQGTTLRAGLEIDWFDAHKRSERDVRKMCAEAGLEVVKSWAIDGSDMRQYLIRNNPDAGTESSSDEKDSAISVSGE